jgi:tRNA(Ile)-lysidine synthase
MQARQRLDSGISVVRPLLSIEKSRLIAACEARGLAYHDDPTNSDMRFTRPRLRQAYDVLAAEGLTGPRLQRTAHRLARSRSALEHYTREAIDSYVDKGVTGWAIRHGDFCSLPEDIALRIIQTALGELGHARDYLPRMQKQENLLARLRSEENFKSATLGGCQFALGRDGEWLSISSEKRQG